MRVCNTLSMDPPSSSQAAETERAATKPLIRGGRDVEEEALVSALKTADNAKNVLLERTIQYKGLGGEVLDSAYKRCGEVTEDYGRTFYLGAPGGKPSSGWFLRHHGLASPSPASPAPTCSDPADERAEAQGNLGDLW